MRCDDRACSHRAIFRTLSYDFPVQSWPAFHASVSGQPPASSLQIPVFEGFISSSIAMQNVPGNVFCICSSTCLLCYETGRTGDAAHWVDLPCCGQEMCSTCLDSLVAIPTSGRIKYVPASLLMLTAPELTTIWRPRCCLSVDLVSHFLCLNLCVPPVCHASEYPQSVLDASACFLLAGSRLPAPFARLHSLMRS